jgi:hypothetical protein
MCAAPAPVPGLAGCPNERDARIQSPRAYMLAGAKCSPTCRPRLLAVPQARSVANVAISAGPILGAHGASPVPEICFVTCSLHEWPLVTLIDEPLQSHLRATKSDLLIPGTWAMLSPPVSHPRHARSSAEPPAARWQRTGGRRHRSSNPPPPPSYSHSENLMNSEQFITFPAESEAQICTYVSGSVLRSVLR